MTPSKNLKPIRDEATIGKLDSAQPLILFGAVFVGIIVGTAFTEFGSYTDAILSVAIIALVYSIMLGVPHTRIIQAFKNIRFLRIAWFANFVVIPLVAWALALIFLGNHPAVYVGLILYLVTPCTDWFLVFTAMAKGDVPLGLALLPTNLILQILLLPIYLFLFAGEIVPLQFDAFVEALLVFILLPFVLAALTRWILSEVSSSERATEIVDELNSPLQLIAMAFVLFIMFAGQVDIVRNNIGPLLLMIIPILFFFILSFTFAQFLSTAFKLEYKERALLTCTMAARNSPLVLAIAVGLFPDRPLIHVAIIIGVLIELPLLSLLVRLLAIIRDRGPAVVVSGPHTSY